MAICAIHSSVRISDKAGGVCSRCKSCTHKRRWKLQDELLWQCSDCYQKFSEKAGESWVLTANGWTEEK